MDGDLLKLLVTAVGSGGLVAALLRVIGPALRLNQVGSDASSRAIAQWTTLYNEQKQETADAVAALRAAEERLRAAEARTAQLEAKLTRALGRISQLEKQALP
jgi:hypothetical protein